ncbi:hypothetical protein [Photobacterium sp. Hal280]|uniref:hypothetical protein n=1 Tax=Photobacterium sp. Hal280 TaxID=3035163 RepID=UPI00301C0976
MNADNVKNELTNWKTVVTLVLRLMEDNKLKQASHSYSEFKKDLSARKNELLKLERVGGLSESEEYLLLPAINEVLLHCNARVGTMNKKKLSETLVDCDDYLDYHLSHID